MGVGGWAIFEPHELYELFNASAWISLRKFSNGPSVEKYYLNVLNSFARMKADCVVKFGFLTLRPRGTLIYE